MKTQNPLIGRASGKFGTAVFQTQFGQNIVRTTPAPYTASTSDAVVLVREKMALLMSYLKTINAAIKKFYPQATVNMPSISYATKYAFPNATGGSVGSPTVDATALFYAPDSLSIASLFSAVKSVADEVTINWTGATLEVITGADKAMTIVLVDNATGDCYESVEAIDTSEETITFNVPGTNTAKTFHFYISVNRNVTGFKPGNELSGGVL